MSNEQLAYAMLMTFKPLGQILSVKASRDNKGRPFGFVEFSVNMVFSTFKSFMILESTKRFVGIEVGPLLVYQLSKSSS